MHFLSAPERHSQLVAHALECMSPLLGLPMLSLGTLKLHSQRVALAL